MIQQNVNCYDFSRLSMTDMREYHYSPEGCALRVRLRRLPDSDRVLFEIPGLLRIRYRLLQKMNGEYLIDAYERGECYVGYGDDEGKIPVLQLEYCFCSEHPDWDKMMLGVPLRLYDVTADDLYALVDRTHFRLVYQNKVVNYNLIYGTLHQPECGEVLYDQDSLAYVEYSSQIEQVTHSVVQKSVNQRMNYYTPYGHNTFIGDLVNFYHDGVYHMLYMPDTHHHGNRWKCGGHHFEHMITTDFITWQDVGPVMTIDEQWLSVGTGTMFYQNGNYYVIYGLHTDRMLPREKVYPISDSPETERLSFAEILARGQYPGGSTYAVSDDGIHFTPSKTVCASVTNPSVYVQENRLLMFSGGAVWEAKDMMSPWHMVREHFPPCGPGAPMHNTGECPSYFTWNGFQYLIMGVTGFWRTEKNQDVFYDYAAKGYDVYEGLSVPMAVKTDDNRVIMAGWLGGAGWGSCVVHRELIQFSDGNLGSKWLPELFPKTRYLGEMEQGTFSLQPCKSYYVELDWESGDEEILAVRLQDGQHEVELSLNGVTKTAQFAQVDGEPFAEPILPMYQLIRETELGDRYGFSIPGNTPAGCRDFSIAHVCCGKEPVHLRMILYYHPKINSTIWDVEINNTRTMISNRVNFFPQSIRVMPSRRKLLQGWVDEIEND